MISVVLATYNEEKNIERCLNSVKGLADEVIVVDGSSTDNTRDIAQGFGAKVIKTSNKPIFHINKQMAMDQAQYELVLQLDADEVVDGELYHFIEELDSKLSNNPDSVVESAWWLKRKNNFLGHWLKKGGQYPDPVVRLFRRGKATLPQKSVHEQMKVDGQIGWADGHLLHYSNPAFSDYLRKFTTYSQLEADHLIAKNHRLSLLFLLSYLFVKPLKTFFLIFLRHKGFVDGIYGLIFAFMSALHFPVIAYKFYKAK